MITIADYKLNNLRSLENTLRRLGHDVRVTSNPDDIRAATKLILPGVGAFGDGMRNLKELGLAEPFIEKVKSGTPTLGICLGMHLLFTESEEFGLHRGLNLLDGRIVKLPANLRVPHMGWNQLHPKHLNGLTSGIADSSFVYFVHSYYAVPASFDIVIATTDYEIEFPAIVHSQNIWATQFHPEKSQHVGEQLLQNFGELMKIYPAIDILDGKAVRLVQGRKEDATVYGDPVEMALKWVSKGADWLHVVDLDGAFEGQPRNIEVVRRMAAAVPAAKIQVGGGIRNMSTVESLRRAGIHRVVLGTAVVQDREFVTKALTEYRDSVAIGIDARDGNVRVSGWTEASNIGAIQLACELQDLGARRVIYTDISRDGVLIGPNVEAMREMIDKTELSVIASGGVSSLSDLQRLAEIDHPRLDGVIIGKALYEGRIQVEEALASAR